jgi:hypothetical protein
MTKDNMLKKIKTLAERVVEYLGIKMIPIEFDDSIKDDSRLILRPLIMVTINGKYQDNYIECAKEITHELRHLFQIIWAFTMNDERARRWKVAYQNPISSEHSNIVTDVQGASKYAAQEIEVDAFAFTKYYLEKYERMKVNHLSREYEKIIRKYLEINYSIL